MATAWYFLVILYGGGSNGVAIAQAGPFASEEQCRSMQSAWVATEVLWRKATPCYPGVMTKGF